MIKLKLKHSKEKNRKPNVSELADGEIVLNIKDGKIFFKSSNGSDLHEFVSKKMHIGIPIPYPKEEIPDGFLAMKGQTFSATDYPVLASLYGNKLPDLRGTVLMGWPNGKVIHTNSWVFPNLTTNTEQVNYKEINLAPHDTKMLFTKATGTTDIKKLFATSVFQYICLAG